MDLAYLGDVRHKQEQEDLMDIINRVETYSNRSSWLVLSGKITYAILDPFWTLW